MTDKQSSEDSAPFWIVGMAAGVLLCVHLGLRIQHKTIENGLDSVALGLAVIALSPWIAKLLKSLKFGGLQVEFQQVKERVVAQGKEISQLKFLIKNFITHYELGHLIKLSSLKSYTIDFAAISPDCEGELRRLRALKFIEQKSNTTIGELFRERKTRDLHNYFVLTKEGREYLSHLEATGGLKAEKALQS
jgi:hypothetical protein